MSLFGAAKLLRKHAVSPYRDKDVELYQKWKQTRSPQDMQALITQMEPVIAREVNRWAGSLSRPMMEARAKGYAVEAIQSYNPMMGTALSTHVTNRIQKISRTQYTHGQAARSPEHKAVAMSTFSQAHTGLSSDLGRDPNTGELAENLGWSKSRTAEFQRAYGRKELLTSGEFDSSAFAINDHKADPMVDFIYHDLAPTDQLLFEDITGYGGKPILKNPELMKKHDLTQGQLSYQKRKLIDAVKRAQ
jgi:DNA-directed RNA polymerase specialized sigma subunit